MKNKVQKLVLAKMREERKKQGFFDGRFMQKSEPSKKHYSRKTKHKNQKFTQ